MTTHYAALGFGVARAAWSGVVPDRVLYRCVLTGAPDALDDVTLPMSGFYSRLYSGQASAHQVSIPYTAAVAAAIDARPNGEVHVYRQASISGAQQTEELLFSFAQGDTQYHRGARNASYTLAGERQTTNSTPVTVPVTGIIDEGVDFNGGRTWTIATYNSVRPGDSVVIGSETIPIDRVQFTAAPTNTTIVIREDAA